MRVKLQNTLFTLFERLQKYLVEHKIDTQLTQQEQTLTLNKKGAETL